MFTYSEVCQLFTRANIYTSKTTKVINTIKTLDHSSLEVLVKHQALGSGCGGMILGVGLLGHASHFCLVVHGLGVSTHLDVAVLQRWDKETNYSKRDLLD